MCSLEGVTKVRTVCWGGSSDDHGGWATFKESLCLTLDLV